MLNVIMLNDVMLSVVAPLTLRTKSMVSTFSLLKIIEPSLTFASKCGTLFSLEGQNTFYFLKKIILNICRHYLHFCWLFKTIINQEF